MHSRCPAVWSAPSWINQIRGKAPTFHTRFANKARLRRRSTERIVGGCGMGLILNYQPSMSALGQKPTCAMQKDMSALPPKADICSAVAYVREGPKKRTASTNGSQPPGPLFDKLLICQNSPPGRRMFNRGETHAHKARFCGRSGLRDLRPCWVFSNRSVCARISAHDSQRRYAAGFISY